MKYKNIYLNNFISKLKYLLVSFVILFPIFYSSAFTHPPIGAVPPNPITTNFFSPLSSNSTIQTKGSGSTIAGVLFYANGALTSNALAVFGSSIIVGSTKIESFSKANNPTLSYPAEVCVNNDGKLHLCSAPVPLNYILTVTKLGAGSGTVTSNIVGINCGTGVNCSASYSSGTSVTLSVGTSTGSVFSGWSGGGCSGTGTCTVVISSATNVTASFAIAPPLNYALTVSKAGTGTGTVTSNPSGINCGADCSESYVSGTSVTLTATPASGSIFSGWSGACSGTGTCTVAMSSIRSVTANFTLAYALTVSVSSGTGTVTSNPSGINCAAGSCSASYASGTSVTLTATPATGSTFNGWSGGWCSGTSPCTVAMSSAKGVGATFTDPVVNYVLTVFKSGTGTITSSPGGINCGADCSESYVSGTSVTLTATPASGSIFSGWSGACSGTGTCTVTMSTMRSASASFTLANTLTVSKAGTGTGTVTSNPSGINCGSVCSYSYNTGTFVYLTAIPTSGHTFTGWSGGGCSGTGTCMVTMSSARNVTASFSSPTYTLTVTKSGTGAGTVTSNLSGINCGSDCSEPYTSGTDLILTATPASGSIFSGWSAGICYGAGTGICGVFMSAAASVNAIFNASSNLFISKLGTGTGSVMSSPGDILCGAKCDTYYLGSITLDATPNSSSSFFGWGGYCGTSRYCTYNITSAPFTARPTFLPYNVNYKTLDITSNYEHPNRCGSVSGSGIYLPGSSVTVSTTPYTGCTFSAWKNGSIVLSNNLNYTFNMPSYNMIIEATYQ